LVFALIDAAKVAGIDVSAFAVLPLFNIGMAWLLPTAIALVAMYFVPGTKAVEQTETLNS
jgi:LIVCS family branched-chain amino acid:cation transporter